MATGCLPEFGQSEADFIAQPDSLYIATASEAAWPYIKHRGRPTGFLRVPDEKTFGFADLRSKQIRHCRQHRNRRARRPHTDRLRKSPAAQPYARTEIKNLKDDPLLTQCLAFPDYKGKV
jgi:uncharacterized protein